MNEKQAGITAKKDKDFSEWYTQVIIKSEFVDYTSVSGALAFRPDSYFVWERIQKETDTLFKMVGIQNVYFPLLIPEKLLEKEKEHVKGFSPEVAWVTQTGDTKLEEKFAVRPTSETIMYDSYSKWIRSWRDLPMRYNQWNSVIRWEFKHPTPFLRSREFLWNEGHTAFATKKEADDERDIILGIYSKILTEYLALPAVGGKKTDKEKFPGAEASYSFEHLMPDGWAIQGPDFHSDGQRFAKAFDIQFIDQSSKKQFVYQNTFAITTRELGVVVATHGDDKGLIIPPRVARIQIVIVPIYKDDTKNTVMMNAESLAMKLSEKFRVLIDEREGYTPGWKYNEWELRGTPIRIEVGAKEIKEMMVLAVRRDTGEKIQIPFKESEKVIGNILDQIHDNLYKKAKKFLDDNTHEVKSYDELKKVIKNKGGGFAQANWCGSSQCEDKAKEETGAKITNLPFDKEGKAKGKCVVCGEKAEYIANFAKSY